MVFAVQGRQNLIRREHNDELQKYMTGITSGQGQKLIAIDNMPDHFHLLMGTFSNQGTPIGCRSTELIACFSPRSYKDFAPTEHAWP